METKRGGGNCDVHKKIKHTISHESFHILVRLPLLRCFVHLNRLLQRLSDSKHQKHSTENKSWDFLKHEEHERCVAPRETTMREIHMLDNCDWGEELQEVNGQPG